jgi:hypothetical protein
MPTPSDYDRAMSDPKAPNPAVDVRPPTAAEYLLLFRQIEGWVDGDLLLAEEAGPLLEEVAAAGRAREAGDPAAVRRHTTCFLRALETLIASRKLDPGNGRPAIDIAREILDDAAD